MQTIRTFFARVEISKTQGHGYKLREAEFKGEVRGKFFAQRMVGAGNA